MNEHSIPVCDIKCHRISFNIIFFRSVLFSYQKYMCIWRSYHITLWCFASNCVVNVYFMIETTFNLSITCTLYNHFYCIAAIYIYTQYESWLLLFDYDNSYDCMRKQEMKKEMRSFLLSSAFARQILLWYKQSFICVIDNGNTFLILKTGTIEMRPKIRIKPTPNGIISAMYIDYSNLECLKQKKTKNNHRNNGMSKWKIKLVWIFSFDTIDGIK